jgi:hypothetical protein
MVQQCDANYKFACPHYSLYSLYRLTIELMVQQCDANYNPVKACSSASPPPQLIQV